MTTEAPQGTVSDDAARRGHWVTRLQLALLGLVALLGGFFAIAGFPTTNVRAQGPPPGFPAPPPGGRGFGGFGPGPGEIELVNRFDKNADKRLDAEERNAAREWLTTSGTGRRGGPRFGGRPMTTEPGRRISPADVRTYSGAPMFDTSTLRTFFLEFENQDWESELTAFYGTDVEVPATVTVDGTAYKDVGVHFRGNSSFRMVPVGAKRSLNLSFDFVHDGQNLGGYRTFNLLNSSGDPTFLRTVLYSHIARQYMPAPKANFVRVVINGESWGIYVNTEQFNRDFAREWFGGTGEGARWKVPGSPGGRAGLGYIGDDPADYKRLYELKTKEDPRAWADLVRLCRLLEETPPEKLEAALAPVLDIDGALKFLAIENALENSDGYWSRASDFSIYRDPTGRFHIIPYDFNEGMGASEGRGGGRGGFGPPGGPGFHRGAELDPLVGLDDPGKPLRSKLLAVPALRQRYLGYVREIAQQWLDWQTLGPLVEQYRSLIAEDVKLDTRKLASYDAFEAGIGLDSPERQAAATSLKRFVERRRAFLLR